MHIGQQRNKDQHDYLFMEREPLCIFLDEVLIEIIYMDVKGLHSIQITPIKRS